MWEIAKSKRLWALRLSHVLIYRLRDWAGEEAVRAWLNVAIEEPETAAKFLEAMLQETNMNGSWRSGGRTTYTLLGERMDSIVDIALLSRSADKAAVTEPTKTALQVLKRAIQLKAEKGRFAELYVITRTPDGSFKRDTRDARF